MQPKMCGNEYRSTVVCIDSYEKRILQGRMYNPFFQGAIPFMGLMDFLLSTDALLDQMNFPQPFAQTRTFGAPAKKPERRSDGVPEQSGKLGTFIVKVIFRQNSSWQGSVFWKDGGREESFRSVLELAFLLDSALEPAQDEKTHIG